MTPRTRTLPRASGVTLVELMVATLITATIAMLATQTFISFMRGDSARRKVADVQGGARAALEVLERELRHASLGAGTGRIWTTSGANRVARPAVQTIRASPGPAPWTSGSSRRASARRSRARTRCSWSERPAARGRRRSARSPARRRDAADVRRDDHDSERSRMTDSLATDDVVLVGDYLDATWAVVAT